MKKFLLLAAVFGFVPGVQSQDQKAKVIYQKCSGFAVTKPLTEMMPLSEDELSKLSEKEEIEIRRKVPTTVHRKPEQEGLDPVAQLTHGNKIMTPTIANWQGQSGSASPPDPSGAASTAFYVQAVNLSFRIYTKTGGAVTGGGPFSLKSLWTGSTNDGDPVVMYDKYADRFVMTQFNGNDLILVAVSTSSNPTGSWYTYTFTPAPGVFPDYPKYSVWADGYYCTSNLGSPENVAVFERTQMIAGNPSAGMIVLTLPNTPNNGFYSPLPADADGQLPPYGTPCPLFSYEDDTWSAGGTDQLHVFKFSADWITPSNSTLVLDQTLSTPTINVNFNVNWNDVSQPGTTQKLDGIAGVLMYRAQYRRWTGYNSVVFNHAVIVDPTTKQVGIRWYELRQNTSTNTWSIYQNGTFAPDLHNRWMGSIAMDDNGSIGMAYAVSSSTVYPSLYFTGRLASDPLGTMTFSESVAFAGTSSQAGFNRFGDYSQTALDPDGITFWHTGEYMSGGQKTRIFSWQIPLAPTTVGELAMTAEIIAAQNESSLLVKASKLPNNEQMNVDLFDIQGKLIREKKALPVNNGLQTTLDISGLPVQTYLVRIGNGQFQKVVKVILH